MLDRRESTDGIVYYVSPLLERLGVRHAFSTRAGGVSPPPFDSMNLGIANDAAARDSLENVEENYRRLRAAVGCADLGRCWIKQVHGADVATVRPGSAFENGACADALVSDDPDRVLSVKYADCVPILLANRDGSAVAAVHAGWRGLVAGMIPAAVRELERVAGQRATEFVAAVGPCIGVAHFEVGPEVVAAFRARMGDAAPVRRGRGGDKGYVDLRRATLAELRAAGVAEERIDTADLCTFANPAEFFSHRRDAGVTGRMAALIVPRGKVAKR